MQFEREGGGSGGGEEVVLEGEMRGESVGYCYLMCFVLSFVLFCGDLPLRSWGYCGRSCVFFVFMGLPLKPACMRFG